MMKIFFTLCIMLIVLFSCKKKVNDIASNNCSNSHYVEIFQEEQNNATLAGQEYGMNPTKENCEEWKKAMTIYVDAIESWKDCAVFTGQQVQWQASVDAARASVDAIVCE